MLRYIFIIAISFIFISCFGQSSKQITDFKDNEIPDTTYKTIHAFVSLCDNKHQNIVPVPKKIGNGQDPKNNLYWGCAYGILTYFKKSNEWLFIKSIKLDSLRLERAVFKHKTKNYYLIADAYNGKHIKECIKHFLFSCFGTYKAVVNVNDINLGIYGHSKLLAYIGHNGLMDFSINENFQNIENNTINRDAIILACASKRYFYNYLKNSKTNPLLWTTNLMAPEAYTLHDALTGYVNDESNEDIHIRAAKAYSKYQKCGEKASQKLIVTGW